MKELKINYLAVLVAVILQFVIGFLWFGPFFEKPWMEMVGLDTATIEANPPGAGIWLTNVLSAALSMYLLAWLFVRLHVNSLARGIWMGFVLGFVFMLLPDMVVGMFNQDPYWLAWITGGHYTVGLMAGGAVLGAWTREA